MTTKLIFTSLVLSALTGSLLVGCGAEQPWANFCDIISANESQYEKTIHDAEGAGDNDLIHSPDAIHGATEFWSQLEGVAPEKIKGAVASLRSSWHAHEKASIDKPNSRASENGSFASDHIAQVKLFVQKECGVTGPNPSAREPQVKETPIAVPKVPGYLSPGSTSYLVAGDFMYKTSLLNPPPVPGGGPQTFFGVYFGDVHVDAKSMFPTDDVVSQHWTVTGKADEQYVVGIVETRIASSGLEPMKFVLSAVKLDLESKQAVVSAKNELSVSECKGAYGHVVGSYSDTFAFTEYRPGDGGKCNGTQFQKGIDAGTAKVRWEADTAWKDAAFGTLVGVSSTKTARYNRECYTYTGIDIATGEDSWVFDSATQAVVDGYCFTADFNTLEGGIARIGNKFPGSFLGYIDIRTGERRTVIEPLAHFDPITKYAVMVDYKGPVTVYDTVTGNSIYEITDERRRALGANSQGLFGGRLFLTTSDQYLEIDTKTGDIVSETQSVLPLMVVNGYVLFSDGKLIPFADVNTYRPKP